jgi:hypothetical protein
MAHVRRAESEFLARLLVMAFNAQAQVVLDLKWVGGKYSIVTGVGNQRQQVICRSLFMFKLDLTGRYRSALPRRA